MEGKENKILYFPKFSVGQIVFHRIFHYRGVVFDIDISFRGSSDWYERFAFTKPQKNRSWYHILVDDDVYTTYVSECNLMKCPIGAPIEHPLIGQFFQDYEQGRYIKSLKENLGDGCLHF